MRLFESLEMNNLCLHTRLVMPPMATERSEGGLVTPEVCNFYRERTQSGLVGLVITEHSYVEERGKASRKMLSIAHDDCIDGLKMLTEAIKSNGSKVFAQLNHAGSSSTCEITNQALVGPSSVRNFSKAFITDTPVALERGDISVIVQRFADAAERAVKAGYDGVELHAAHGYLLNQFYTPLLNKRCDEYGSDCIENRVRIHLEVIRAIRDTIGKKVPLAIRFGGCDYMNGGSTLSDCAAAVKLFEQAGVNLIDISGGLCHFHPVGREGVLFSDMSVVVKNNVSVPVILTGGITDIETANMLITDKHADLIGIGRPVLKDANWLMGALHGELVKNDF